MLLPYSIENATLRDVLDYFTSLIIIHLFGVIIGAGGAFASDLMFFHTIRDKKISRTETRFLILGSRMVWTGLLIIAASGFLIFMTNTAGYLASDKFLAKMTIVSVLVLNGIIFHTNHIPLLRRHSNGKSFAYSPEFMGKRSSLLFSGVISMTSWLSAFMLGSLKNVPYSYTEIMSVYIILLIGGFIVALLIKNRLLPPLK